ncbi:MAG: NifB/NifX family molybdenum-iron cluster-binding protein [Oscillospiraceae bacterium]|nr:NifB/NifX family molybdenum-iron cluster-binding protein [Oscillospiraceae bacterium]
MKVAVTYENGQVFQHFGHTRFFKVYEIKDAAIVSEAVLPTMGSGHGALAGFLSAFGVDALICGGIGGGARTALAEAGIALYPGASGSADEQVKALMEGRLAYDPDTVCSHHHGEHDCSDHDCGDHDHNCGGHCH